jgi:hypothetical protein
MAESQKEILLNTGFAYRSKNYDRYGIMSETNLRLLVLARRYVEKYLATDGTAASIDEYDLKIDGQVEKFLDLKQKLTYFLVTASIGPIAFALSFVKDVAKHLFGIWIAMFIGILLGLVATGCALYSLHLELGSYQKHLGYRYARKQWEDLSKDAQTEWDDINARAGLFLKFSFIALFAEVTALTLFLMVLLHRQSS